MWVTNYASSYDNGMYNAISIWQFFSLNIVTNFKNVFVMSVPKAIKLRMETYWNTHMNGPNITQKFMHAIIILTHVQWSGQNSAFHVCWKCEVSGSEG